MISSCRSQGRCFHFLHERQKGCIIAQTFKVELFNIIHIVESIVNCSLKPVKGILRLRLQGIRARKIKAGPSLPFFPCCHIFWLRCGGDRETDFECHLELGKSSIAVILLLAGPQNEPVVNQIRIISSGLTCSTAAGLCRKTLRFFQGSDLSL